MAEDNELEKRAVEELLRETDRARLRAQTMGPAGWLKCPLRSTNKRFLLNTLRSSGLQRRSGAPGAAPSATRGRRRGDSPRGSRDRSRTPPRDHRSSGGGGGGGHRDHKHHHRDSCNNKDKKQDRDKERRHRDNREQRCGRDGQSRDKDAVQCTTKDSCPEERL